MAGRLRDVLLVIAEVIIIIKTGGVICRRVRGIPVDQTSRGPQQRSTRVKSGEFLSKKCNKWDTCDVK